MDNKKHLMYKEDLMLLIRDDLNINGRNFAMIKKHIDEAPTVDAVEVVHGQWVYESVEFTYEKDIKCSVCGCYVEHVSNYCHNCGAKMDGGNI